MGGSKGKALSERQGWVRTAVKLLGWAPDSPSPCVSARQQPGLTAQQLVLHTVALQRTATLRLLPAYFQRRGPRAENTRRVGRVGHAAARRSLQMGRGHSQPPAGVSGQESLVLSRTSLTAGRAAHSAPQHPLSRPVPPHHTQVWVQAPLEAGPHPQLAPLPPQPQPSTAGGQPL